MKKTIQLFTILILALSVTYCGKKKGGGGDSAPATQRTTDASEIQVDDGSSNPVIWSNSANNIYTSVSASCVRGLSTSADDSTVKEFESRLLSLVNAGSAGKGTKDSISSRSVYMSIRYSNGEVKTFNLVNEVASKTEDVLSNGGEILAFFAEVETEIQRNGRTSCSYGK